HGRVSTLPAAHAGLGELFVVRRRAPDAPESCTAPRPVALHDLPRRVELRLRGPERVPVMERPAVELRVRELGALRAERLREPDERLHLMQVRSMQHYIHGEREAELLGVTVGG